MKFLISYLKGNVTGTKLVIRCTIVNAASEEKAKLNFLAHPRNFIRLSEKERFKRYLGIRPYNPMEILKEKPDQDGDQPSFDAETFREEFSYALYAK